MISTNVIDIIILVIFFASVMVGFGRGLVSEAVSLAAVIAAIMIGIMFTSPLANWFTGQSAVQSAVSQSSNAIGVSTQQPISYIAIGFSFALLFAATIIIGALIKALLNTAFRAGMLGIGNRVLGGVFGLGRGYLLTVVFIFIVELTPFSANAMWTGSQYVPSFQPAVVWLSGMISPALGNLKNKLTTTIQGVGTSLQNTANQYTH